MTLDRLDSKFMYSLLNINQHKGALPTLCSNLITMVLWNYQNIWKFITVYLNASMRYRSYFILRLSFLITSSVTNIYDLSRLVVDPRGRKLLRNFSTLISRLSAL